MAEKQLKKIAKRTLTTAIAQEKKLRDAAAKAKGELLKFYKAFCEKHNLLNEKGLPVTSGKVLVKVFHDYPLNEENQPVGIETAKTEHDGAALMKRAYMSIAQEKRQQATKDTGKGKKAGGKGKGGDGGKPEVISKEKVLAYLKRNHMVAFSFVLEYLETEAGNQDTAFVANDAHEAISSFLEAVNNEN